MFLSVLGDLNRRGIVLTTVVYTIVGSLWYGPLMFVKPRAEDLRLKEQGKMTGKMERRQVPLNMVLYFLLVTVMALLIRLLGITTWTDALVFGLMMGLIYDGSQMAGSAIWAQPPVRLLLINAGYVVVGTVISCLILVNF